MTDEPERIWTTGNDHTGSWNIDDVAHCPGTAYVRADIHDRVCDEWAEVSQNNYQIAKDAVAERDALADALTTMGVDPASIIAAMARRRYRATTELVLIFAILDAQTKP